MYKSGAGIPQDGKSGVAAGGSTAKGRRLKDALLASSAAAGTLLLSGAPGLTQELELSAFQRFLASGGGSDSDTYDRGFAFSTDTEVHVNGAIMADNGITFGFRVEFEADGGATGNVDENSVWASGSFGKIEFGNNDGVEDTFLVNGSNSGVEYGAIGNPTSSFLTTAFVGSARTSAELRKGSIETADATKISYTTPTFNGFSAGISYTPDTGCGTQGKAFCPANSTGVHDNVAIAAAYGGEFSGVDLKAAVVGGVGHADADPEDGVYGIGGGFAAGFSGITIAAGLVWDDLQGNGGEGWAVDLGLAYDAGLWHFSLNGVYSEDDDSGDELHAGSATVIYNATSGVTVFAVGYLGEEDLGSGGSNEIIAITSGLKMAF